MRSNVPQRGRSISPQPEEAFTFQVPLVPAAFSDLRYANKQITLPEVQEPGRAFLFDLSARPTVGLNTEFDNFRLYISQKAIDEISLEKGMRRIGGLVQPHFGNRDPILFHLVQILVPALDVPDLVSAAFVEYVALAFHQHIVTTYGGLASSGRRRDSRLAPWQMRRIEDFIRAHAASNPSLTDLARQCGLSTSYFSEAFKQTTSLAPHQWLLRQRIARAKTLLLDTDLSLATIAADCGFVDQSHFSRVFSRLECCSPSLWRRRRLGR